MYHEKTGGVLQALGYTIDDYIAERTPGGIALTWMSEDPQPTEQQVSDWATDATPLPGGQLFSDWQADHGGDPEKTERRKASEKIDKTDVTMRIVLGTGWTIVKGIQSGEIAFGTEVTRKQFINAVKRTIRNG